MKMIKIAKKGFNVEIYIDRDYNVDININNKNITYCDGGTPCVIIKGGKPNKKVEINYFKVINN